MHEVGIAASILESVETEAERRPGTKILAIGLRIGELSNVDKDALAFAFEALTQDTPLATTKLEVEWRPRRQKCLECTEEFVVKQFDLRCPACGTDKTSCIGGTELDVAYLEIEEEPCAKS